MEMDLYWGEGGNGALAAASVGITNPIPLMVKSRRAGGDGFVFETADGTVYLWSIPLDDVYKYTKPATRELILAEMRKPAARGKVEMQLMPRIS